MEFMRGRIRLLSAIFLGLLFTGNLLTAQPSKATVAEPVPIGPEGTQIATEDTPTAAENTDTLRKASQNPIASLISVPVQNNNNFGINPGYRTQDVLNIQPVVPVGISKDWNLVIRWITPIVYQPLPNQAPPAGTGVYGLGDMQPTFFMVPKKSTKIIWGPGVIFQVPTATSRYLGQGKLGIGPTFVALIQPAKWTVGLLTNNIWSVAGSGGRTDVNQFLLQYFVNYNLKHGWYVTSAPILNSNWKGTNGMWTVPFGGGVGRIMKLGFQPVNLSSTFYGNAVYPSGTSSWNMKLQIAFLFPKLTKEQQVMMMEQHLKQMKEEVAKGKP
jgi:hypothetical protein